MEATTLKRIEMHNPGFDLKTRRGRLQYLRWKNGLSQNDAAESIGLPRGTYGNWEYFDNRHIPFDELERIAKFFKTTPEYILTGDSGDNVNINTQTVTGGNASVNTGDDPYKEKYIKTLEELVRTKEELDRLKKRDN